MRRAAAWTVVIAVMMPTTSARATERARGAARRVVHRINHVTTAAGRSDDLKIAIKQVLSGLKPTTALRMRRYKSGYAWDNRVRRDSRRELYWRTLDGSISDVRIVEKSAGETRFVLGRNEQGTLDTWGHLSADGKRAVLTTEHGKWGQVQHLVLTQLSATRVGFDFERHAVGVALREKAEGVIKFDRPVSLAQLTVKAARKADSNGDYLERPLLPKAVNEQTGRKVRISTTSPWVDLMMFHGGNLVLHTGSNIR